MEETKNIPDETGALQETVEGNNDIIKNDNNSNTEMSFSEDNLSTIEGNQNLTQVQNGNAVNKTELDYTTTTGLKLKATPEKTTTILGTFKKDTKAIIGELGNIKSLDFGPRDGGFNLLNTPDELYSTPEQFWEEYNKPWLDQVIKRGDIIFLATEPNEGTLYWTDPILGKRYTGFGREYTYLLENGYYYDRFSKRMVKGE